MTNEDRAECAVDGCDRPWRTRGWCMAHYNQWFTTGIIPTLPYTDQARFSKFVAKGNPDECWLWLGQIKRNGYGRFSLRGTSTSAHRASYLLHTGPIPDGLLIRHTCDNRPCVNPRHLIPGTHLDNRRDAVERNRIPRGEAQRTSKLTLEQVQEIRTATRVGREKQRDVARRYGVSKATVQRIYAGTAWTGLGEVA